MLEDGQNVMLIDGATGTELDRRGVDVSLPLWSARALIDAPDVVEQVHSDYLEAGADAIVTNTFRTHRRSLSKGDLGDRARELTQLAVDIARSACSRVKPGAKVLGSVAPLEDCYHPEMSPDIEDCKAEHAEMITHLLDAGVDALLLETMNTPHEATAAAAMAKRLAPGRWMLSFCVKPDGPPGVLLGGPPMIDVMPIMQDAAAVGVNCVAAPAIEAQVALLRGILHDDVPIIAYGNVGTADEEGNWLATDAIDPERYADYAASWIEAGASVVGGCCGTTPEMIRAISGRLRG
jgi:homocysteine S-methyltransferase